jgi:glucokinase-like ROK family protein
MAIPATADQGLVRKLNTVVILDALRRFAPLSRADLAARTGLNRSTVSAIVNGLVEQGFVQETDLQSGSIGRPGMLLELNPRGGYAVGIEIGVDFISVILTDFVANILWQRRENLHPGADRISMMEQAEEMIAEAVDRGRDAGLRPIGIGVGVPGLVDARQGKLVFAPNLQWVDIPIRLIWMSRFNMPVFVENEANCAAMGELFYGVAHDTKDFIYLKTGVGLGAGIMIGGQLFKGAHGFAGEVGHMTLYGSQGETCGCGRRGCWETYVRPSAVISAAIAKAEAQGSCILAELTGGDLHNTTIEILVAAAERGDEVALSTFAEIGQHLGIGLTNLVNAINPEMVVLGGTLSLCGKWLAPVIQDLLERETLPPLRERVHVEVSAQGEDACALGAIAYVMNNLLQEPINAL